MAWATYYDYHGEIRHVGKDELKSQLQELINDNDVLWNKILTLMAMTPMDQKNGDGYVEHWADYVNDSLTELREQIEENIYRVAHLNDAIEAQTLNPKSVHDDGDEWDEEKQQWKN